MVFTPERQSVLPQVVLVVQEQLFQACPCHPYQLKFGFFGSTGSHSPLTRPAFSDVLLAASRRLHHLVMSAGSPIDKAVAEHHCCVMDDLCRLVGFQVFVAAVGRDDLGGSFW
jgi:hypothetical protein